MTKMECGCSWTVCEQWRDTNRAHRWPVKQRDVSKDERESERDRQTGHEQTAIGVYRAPRHSVTARHQTHQEHRRPNRLAKEPSVNHIRSRHNRQKSMNKNKVGLWRGVEPCKKVSSTPLLPPPCFEHDLAGSRTLLECSPAARFQARQAGVLTRYTIRELLVSKRRCDNSMQISRGYQKHFLDGEPRAPADMFQAWEAGVLIRYTTRELSVLKTEVW